MRQTSRATLAVLVAAVLSLTAGCGRRDAPPAGDESGETPPADRRGDPQAGEENAGPQPAEQATSPRPVPEIEILCGTSFGPPMEELLKQYEGATGNRAVLVFGGSEDHLPKVQLKAAGDVYVTHTPYMQRTKEAGALLRRVDVGFLAPVLVVRRGNPRRLSRFEDLAQEGLEVVLPNPEFSTCGEMVFRLLEKKGIKDAVMKNVGNALVKHHATVGNQLKIGAREAGIMWNGVAHNFRGDLDVVPLPYEYDAETRVAVMGLSYSTKREAVQRFLDFVEAHGKEVFGEFGYVK